MNPAQTHQFHPFPHGHQDLVLAAAYNFYGDRLATASADHRLKVWEKKGADGWDLVDSWRGHEAEVTDVKWTGPFTGVALGSIAEDGLFKLWQEDISQAPLSGRRFQLILKVPSKSKLPWQSLDFKSLDTETYLALITRDGRLSLMEPLDHDRLSGDWKDWYSNPDDLNVCSPGPTPPRSEEASFKVCFHAEKLPCWAAMQAGLDRRALSLAVAAMHTVKIYRTDRNKRLYLAAELGGARDIVRDIAWANGSVRGWDVIAAASKDGAARIYNLKTAASPTPPTASAAAVEKSGIISAQDSGTGSAAQKRSGPPQAPAQVTPAARSQPATAVQYHATQSSGITSGLANAASRPNAPGYLQGQNQHQPTNGNPAPVTHPVDPTASFTAQDASEGRIRHEVVLDAELVVRPTGETQGVPAEAQTRGEDQLRGHAGRNAPPIAIWRVEFSAAGDVLVTTGDDGAVRTWKKGVDNTWREYAVVEVRPVNEVYGGGVVP